MQSNYNSIANIDNSFELTKEIMENISITEQRQQRDRAICEEYAACKDSGTPRSVLITRIAANHGVTHNTAANAIKAAGLI